MLKIYHYDITKMSDTDFLNMYLSADDKRKAKVDKLKDATKKKLLVAAGELVKSAISENFDIDKDDIRFFVDEKGKPYVKDRDVNFSISHSGKFVVCAVSDSTVGIDIERVRDVNMGVAKKYFTLDEQDYVFGGVGSEKERFFEVWTRKEAYAKMTGKGLFHTKNFSTVGNENIKTYTKDGYTVSVATLKK